MRFISLSAVALVAMAAVSAKECTTDEAKASMKLDVTTSACVLKIDQSGACSDECFKAMQNAATEAPDCTKGTNTATEREMAARFFKQCEEARSTGGAGNDTAASSLIDDAAIAALTEEPSSAPTATTSVPTTTPSSSASLISTSVALVVATVCAFASML